MPSYSFYWRDGKVSHGSGPTPEAALTGLGYGAGSIAALDYFETNEGKAMLTTKDLEQEALMNTIKMNDEPDECIIFPAEAAELLREAASLLRATSKAESQAVPLIRSSAKSLASRIEAALGKEGDS